MKKILSGFLFLSLLSVFSFADDPYEKMAQELSSKAEGIKKIAIIPFSYADNTASTKDGSVISERLTMKFINLQKFEIIERSVLDKVLAELKLQNSGVIDSSSAKELGKVLGVDAIITGTLVPTAEGKIEVNARIIKTETAQAIGASQVYVVKDWLGGEVQPVKQVQPQYQPAQQTSGVSFAKQTNNYSYFEAICGIGSQKLTATADSSLPFPGLAPPGWSKLNDVKVIGVGPAGIRWGFYDNLLGGDLEFSFFQHRTPKQNILFSNGQILTMPDGYFNVNSLGISFDILLRTVTKLQFYFGLGFGMSMNRITSTYITDKYNRKLDEWDIGWILRVPLGLRFNIDNTTFFLEWRAESNYTSFDRGNYGSESNKLDFTGSRFVFGAGSRF